MRALASLAFGLALPLALNCAPEASASRSMPNPTGTGGLAGGSATTPVAMGGRSGIALDSAGRSSAAGMRACATDNTEARPAPLDIYVLLDISGSMLDRTANGTTKWDSIKNAITAFLQNSGSSEISVGIQYFPLRKAGVPARCTRNEECGAGGPCTFKWCTKYGSLVPNGIAICETDADCSSIPTRVDYGPCGAGACSGATERTCTKDADCQVSSAFNYGPCSAMGNCSLAPEVACAPNTSCGPGSDGKDRGACIAATTSFCFHNTQCDSSAYASPAVEIGPLPDASSALLASLGSQQPQGDTPTGPALLGAISHARSWATAHSGHTVVAVLATDGMPTECLPSDVRFTGTSSSDALVGEVEAIAAEGIQGSPHVSTFVIGVFASADLSAPENLERIARAGGTQKAQMVDTGGDVTQQFLAALDAVRSSRLACEFQIPQPTSGSDPDFFKVNVLYQDGTEMVPLLYVGSQERCDPAEGGWYYDDGQGVSPTKILVCPANCQTFQNTAGSVQVQLGCRTMVA